MNGDLISLLQPYFAIFLVMGAIILGTWWQHTSAVGMLTRWAQSNGLTIVSSSFSFFGGPFWWRRGRSQYVLEFVAQKPNGEQRRGHALCGSFWWGLMSDSVTVEWA